MDKFMEMEDMLAVSVRALAGRIVRVSVGPNDDGTIMVISGGGNSVSVPMVEKMSQEQADELAGIIYPERRDMLSQILGWDGKDEVFSWASKFGVPQIVAMGLDEERNGLRIELADKQVFLAGEEATLCALWRKIGPMTTAQIANVIATSFNGKAIELAGAKWEAERARLVEQWNNAAGRANAVLESGDAVVDEAARCVIVSSKGVGVGKIECPEDMDFGLWIRNSRNFGKSMKNIIDTKLGDSMNRGKKVNEQWAKLVGQSDLPSAPCRVELVEKANSIQLWWNDKPVSVIVNKTERAFDEWIMSGQVFGKRMSFVIKGLVEAMPKVEAEVVVDHRETEELSNEVLAHFEERAAAILEGKLEGRFGGPVVVKATRNCGRWPVKGNHTVLVQAYIGGSHLISCNSPNLPITQLHEWFDTDEVFGHGKQLFKDIEAKQKEHMVLGKVGIKPINQTVQVPAIAEEFIIEGECHEVVMTTEQAVRQGNELIEQLVAEIPEAEEYTPAQLGNGEPEVEPFTEAEMLVIRRKAIARANTALAKYGTEVRSEWIGLRVQENEERYDIYITDEQGNCLAELIDGFKTKQVAHEWLSDTKESGKVFRAAIKRMNKGGEVWQGGDSPIDIDSAPEQLAEHMNKSEAKALAKKNEFDMDWQRSEVVEAVFARVAKRLLKKAKAPEATITIRDWNCESYHNPECGIIERKVWLITEGGYEFIENRYEFDNRATLEVAGTISEGCVASLMEWQAQQVVEQQDGPNPF